MPHVFAFAAILADGSVVTWGDPIFGGDSSAVQDQLKTVQHIQATGLCFRSDSLIVAVVVREAGAVCSSPDSLIVAEEMLKLLVSKHILNLG